MDAPAPSKRLFIGLMTDARVQAELAAYQASWEWPPGARLTPAANLHLTLHFLGSVGTQQEARLRSVLAEVRTRRLSLVLDTPGQFPKGIAFIAPAHNAALDEWRNLTAVAVDAAGLTVDKQWHPHVTLARRAEGARPPIGPVSAIWTVSQFALVWSHGGSYEPLGHWPNR